MIGVIPLAGPDFVQPDGSVKALMAVDGKPLLRRALESRSWWLSGELAQENLVFVMRDLPATRRFAKECLASWYPAAQHVFLSAFTGGAALSALAGVALFAHVEAPLCVDLVDILYEDGTTPSQLFASRSAAGGLALYFQSSSPFYSYLELAANGLVRRSREKEVISSHASAGTYFFRSPAVYTSAVAHSLYNRRELAYRDLVFVCPTLNGVIEAGWDVHAAEVRQVVDIGLAGKTEALRRERRAALQPFL
jgi:hypothetical protein